MPPRPIAQRSPATARSAARSDTRSDRTRADSPRGATATSSSLFDGSGVNRAGHDDADAVDDEGAVDGETKLLFQLHLGRWQRHRSDVAAKRVEARAIHTGRCNDAAEVQSGLARERRDGAAYVFETFWFHAVGLRHRRDTALYAQQPQQREMFQRLRHRTVVRGNDQQRVLMGRYARDHVVYEAVMAGNVDEADSSSVDIGVRETEIYREPAAFLFGERVGVNAR